MCRVEELWETAEMVYELNINNSEFLTALTTLLDIAWPGAPWQYQRVSLGLHIHNVNSYNDGALQSLRQKLVR